MVLVAAVVADTHMPRGSRRLPDVCLQRMAGADLILHGGDLSTRSFLAELRGLGPPVHAIAGNADEAALRDLLPEELVVDIGRARIGLVRDPGSRPGRERRLAARFPGCDAVVYGHTHVPQVDRHEGTWILNPGSPTERRRAASRSMLVLAVADDGTIAPELVAL